jgi:Tfp pilus tip-associated adhesin PilY1
VAAADLDGDGWIDIVYVGDNTGIEVMRQRRF